MAEHDQSISRLKDVPLEQVHRLILVDVQEPERIGPLKVLSERKDLHVHIFDHHGQGEGSERSAWPSVAERHIEPVGATVTLLIERLNARQVALTADEATVLAIGLYEETGSLAYPRRRRATWKRRRVSCARAPI